ncbi:cupin domain-containing protein [Rudaeicoccus suwonensis]|uniref:(S)-ureidoglycine aminohydrolase cupin domain-containing protein n=1 Tax=Rudaeicoccus suwonensis TaxID=657409 RepID=A0A561E4E8_9MICO|nr:cupin domain-containing protein [Rudaeicoccus suwonensis]TWE10482.1 hypothetical protein BKA23_2844 [Rudaeicoccus suwonensis]
MRQRLYVPDVTAGELAQSCPPGTSVVQGEPTAAYTEFGGDGDGDAVADDGLDIGLWEMTPGIVTDVEQDECFLVVAGEGSVTFEDGTTLALRPGTLVQLHEGERTTWTVIRTLRKVYVAGRIAH